METRSRRKKHLSEEQFTFVDPKEDSSLYTYIEDFSNNSNLQNSPEISPFYEQILHSTPIIPIKDINCNNINESSTKRSREKRVKRTLWRTQHSELEAPENKFVPSEVFFSAVKSKKDLDQHFESDAKKRQRESTYRLSIHKPYSDYIPYSSDEELEEWWSQKKTDYTYSHSITYRSTATPDRRVGSPNMSRRRLRTDKLNYEDFYNDYSTNSEYSSRNNLSLRSRNVDRNSIAGSDFSASDSTTRSATTDQQQSSVQQRLDYGLDDSDSEGESFASTKRYQSPRVRTGNGHPTKLVTKTNGTSTTTATTYAGYNVNDYGNNTSAAVLQRKQTDSFPTYTADDDRPSRVFIKKVTARLSHIFYTFWSWICTFVTSAASVIKNPIVAATSFQSWSARDRAPKPWQHTINTTTTHVNTTSQTTVTYVRQYVSSLVNACSTHYGRKKRSSPLLWWWIPLLLLLALSLLALWWQYGELYAEQTLFLTSRLQSVKDAYFPTDSQWLQWVQSLIARGYTLFGQAALSIWILIKGFVLAIPAVFTPYFIGNESAIGSQHNFGTNEIQTMFHLMRETLNNHDSHLVKLEDKMQSEMALISANFEAFKVLSEKRSLNEETIAELEKQQNSLLIRLEALTSSVKSIALKSKDSDKTEERRIVIDQVSSLSGKVDELNEDLVDLKSHYAELKRIAAGCCNKTFVTADDMERHMVLATTELQRGFNASLEEVRNWVKNYFMAKGVLDARMSAAVHKYKEDLTEKNQMVMQTFQQTANIMLQESLKKFKSELDAEKLKYAAHTKTDSGEQVGEGSFSAGLATVRGLWNQSKIESIVNEMLKKYDADRTGMVDHALESAGGTIESTRCTESYQVHFTEKSWFSGWLWWKSTTNSPRSIIQPNRNPGECWAFRGSLGYVVIQLATPVRVSGFTVEHIPKSLSPGSTIDSAPRRFSVYALQSAVGPPEERHQLGNYTFLDNGEPLQYFEVQRQSRQFFSFVELNVHSNHGNINYTCVYRFRVHGIRANDIY